MRTKTLLLTAALTAAGIASSMAQVYSVNMVGYINKSLPTGYYMVANQLDNGTGNKVTDLLPNPPEGTTVFKFNGTSYSSITFADGAWEGSDPNMTMAPGEGTFIKSPTAFTATFVGEVKLDSSLAVPTGYSVRSSVIPQSAPIDQMGYVASEGDILFFFSNASGSYQSAAFADGAWEGSYPGAPNAPTPDIGQSFFFKLSSAKTWDRHFTVN